jgi:hypothetical protein
MVGDGFKFDHVQCDKAAERITSGSLVVKSFPECKSLCEQGPVKNCKNFVFLGARWGKDYSRCWLLREDQVQPLPLSSEPSGCAVGYRQ